MRSAAASLFPAGVLMTGLGTGPWAAAQPPAAAFDALKKAHTAEVDKTVLPLRGEFCRALQELEQKLASKGDYEGVRAVQKERRAMEELMKSSTDAPAAKTGAPPEVAADGSLPLETAAAETSGGVKPDESGKALTGWDAAGAAARWLLPPGLPEGGYEVEISFRLSVDSAGSAAVFQVSGNLHTLSRPLKSGDEGRFGGADKGTGNPSETASAAPPAPDAEGWRKVALGTLRMHANAPFLELKAVTPESTANDLRIRSVRLIPTATGP
ncbi:MAG: hypothetical protein JWM59_4653 [Verrucomicrobiales bacterium]|nr:hypothetical protein [Verrucomicrobiales bacterium]